MVQEAPKGNPPVAPVWLLVRLIEGSTSKDIYMHPIKTFIAGLVGLAISVAAGAADIDWNKVDQALGRPGANLPGGVHKYGLPRSDLKITVDGVALKPALALGSWIAFIPMDSGA